MKLRKIICISDLAHFKIPITSKIQRTYIIPPISTVVGILKNIYGDDINNFVFGYTIKHQGIHKEIATIYKEVNTIAKSMTCAERFRSDITTIEYLINPKLIIYTDLDRNLKLNDVLNLGKTDCLAKISIENIELVKKFGLGFNQYTSKNIGDGFIRRINTLTKYSTEKGYYEYKGTTVKENYEFEYEGFFDNDLNQSIFLWKWNEGEICEFK